MSEFRPLTQDETNLYQRIANSIQLIYSDLNLDQIYQKAYDMVNLFRNNIKKRKRADLPRCKTCLWFATIPRADGTLSENAGGYCYYYGPINNNAVEHFDWPIVSPNNTCPKHEHVQS
jgi:hypothetical protein